MECKVRYFLSYYMLLVLWYILINSLFVHMKTMQALMKTWEQAQFLQV